MSELTRYRMLIDGDWVEAGDGRVFESVNPSTGEPWALIPEATAADVDRAVRAAYRAFSEGPWASALPTQRGRYLRRLAELLADQSEGLGRTETVDTGKMLKETRWQAKYIAEFFQFYAGCADKIHGMTLPIDKPDMHAMTLREPLGVVAAVVPWNSQLFLVAVKIGPALAAGNTVVLKASEHASAALLEFGRLIEQAGFPPGVVNIVTGHGDPCGRALTSHPLVHRISFTGGPGSAREVIRNSAENFAQVSLELGGKSPFIVFDDADIESAVNGSVAGIFGATGQSCVAGSRLYLHERIADTFLQRMTAMAAGIRIGDPLAEETQMGPLATLGQLSRIEQEVAHAQEEGGRLLSGGRRPPQIGRGWFYEPTIIECPRQSLRVVGTELFGPVLSVLRFKEEEEVVRLANDSRYGLAAGIFTRNGARALRVSKAVRAGIVWVNTYRVVSPIAEFGGYKDSGYGRESGLQAVYDYTRAKTVWINTSDAPLTNPFVMR
ncbi:MAG: aldehyde dehydrogenase [Dongiaceae bacterium]